MNDKNIYKYRAAFSYDNQGNWKPNEYTVKIISERSLFFSNPRDFNDPFELRPVLKPPSKSSLKIMINQSAKTRKRRRQAREFIKASDRSNEYTDLLNEVWEDGLLQGQIRICCFSLDDTNIPMWSYYAQGHSGLCFEFDKEIVIRGTPSAGRKVSYVPITKRPNLNPSNKKNVFRDTLTILHTKSIEWQHEKEYRVVWPGMTEQSNYCLIYPKEALTSLTFGCNASKDTIEFYSDLLFQNGFEHTKLKVLVRDRSEYKLYRVDL